MSESSTSKSKSQSQPIVLLEGGRVLGTIDPMEYARLLAEKKIGAPQKGGFMADAITYHYDENGRINSKGRKALNVRKKSKLESTAKSSVKPLKSQRKGSKEGSESKSAKKSAGG